MTTNPSAVIETITPDIARAFLSFSEGNRSIRKTRVDQYADDMSRARWQLTGEPVIFNGKALVNGHHRLLACIQADVPFQTVVVRGVSEAAYDVIDSGLPRSPGDVAAHHGFTDPNNKASCARLLHMLRHGNIRDAHTAPTRSVLMEFMEANADDLDWANHVGRRFRVTVSTCSQSHAAASVLWLADHSSQDVALAFVEPVITGAGLAPQGAQLALRNFFMNRQGTTRARTTGIITISAFVRAWNAWVEQRPVNHIKPWIPGQPFPEIVRFSA